MNDSNNVLIAQFNNDAAYDQYRLHYDSRSHLIRKIEYYIKEIPADQEESGSDIKVITITLSNYSGNVISDEVFREDKYVFVQNGQLYTKPAYSNFKLVTNISK